MAENWAPSRDFEIIRQMTIDLQNDRSPLIQRMLEVQAEYDADLVVPLPDVSNEPSMPNLTPQMMADVIDKIALRACSVRPNIHSPAIDPNLLVGPRSLGYAKDRIRILNATYDASNWLLGRRRAMRHFNAYDTHAIAIEPDFHAGGPRIRVRNPLETFPEARAVESFDAPEHVAFITRYSGSYLRARYPQVRAELGGPITDVDQTQRWDIFEWYDTEQIRFGLLGPCHAEGDHINERYQSFAGPWMPLTDPVRNRAERCLAIAPQAVTLHTIGNRLNRLIGNVRWQNRLMALEILATEKAIFPDMAIFGRQGMRPTLIDGEWKDGRTGDINMIEGADAVQVINQQPGAGTSQVIDRLQYGFQSSSDLDPMMYGESRGSSLRTGRALGKMAEISIDPRIQELHEIDETWQRHMNSAILEAYKGWWPTKTFTIFSGWPGDVGQVVFTPNECIETSDNAVSYAIPGADIAQITQILGSMHGADVLSTDSFQRAHPFIADPHEEQVRVMKEKLDRATLEGLMQQVASGQMPMAVYARIREKYNDGDIRLEQAIVEVDNEIREQQLAAQQAAAEQAAQEPDLSSVLGLAAGPAAAAPGAPQAAPPTPAGLPPAAGGPIGDMRQLLTAANPGV